MATPSIQTPVAYQNLFGPRLVAETSFFDEGPLLHPRSADVNSNITGALNTSAVDPYTQGVEITRMRQWDAGVAKIWSGEPQHRLLKNHYGDTPNFLDVSSFQEKDYFNPVTFLIAQQQNSPLFSNIITFPIITGNNTQLENYNFNGVIEPLTIRTRASFFSIETPFESHEVKGAVMSGNPDSVSSSDVVLSVDWVDVKNVILPYIDLSPDAVTIFTASVSGYFHVAHAVQAPFADIKYPRNTQLPVTSSVSIHTNGNSGGWGGRGSDMDAYLGLMTGSTDNYIRFNKRSAVSGWVYDSVAGVGTDSLAFGGMTY